MGGSSSTAVVNSVVRSFCAVINTSSQSCYAPYTGSQSVVIVNSDDVNIDSIDMSQMSTVDVDCVANMSSDASVTSAISEQVEQESEALTQGFGLNSADSATCARMVEDLATEVVNDYSQTIDVSISQAQVVNIEDSSGVVIPYIDMTQVSEATVDATLTTATSSTAASSLATFLEQHSSASKKGLGLLGILIIVIVVFVLFIGGVALNVLLTPAFWFLISTLLLIVFGYFTLAYFPLWWPYEAYVDTDTDEERADKEDHNTTSVKWYGGFALFFLAFDAIMIFAAAFMGGWGGSSSKPKEDTATK